MTVTDTLGRLRAVLLTGGIPVGDVILGLEIMAQFGTHIGNGIRCGAAALSVADALGGFRAVLLTGGIAIGFIRSPGVPQSGRILVNLYIGCTAAIVTAGSLVSGIKAGGIIIGNIVRKAVLIGVTAALVIDGYVIGTAGVGTTGCFRAVCHTGCIIVGGIFPQLMPQGGVQQLCGDFRAAAAQVGNRGVIEAGCLGAGFQSHAGVGMGTAAVIVQQLFGGFLALVCAGGIIANGTGGQAVSIGDNFAVAPLTATDV